MSQRDGATGKGRERLRLPYVDVSQRNGRDEEEGHRLLNAKGSPTRGDWEGRRVVAWGILGPPGRLESYRRCLGAFSRSWSRGCGGLMGF